MRTKCCTMLFILSLAAPAGSLWAQSPPPATVTVETPQPVPGGRALLRITITMPTSPGQGVVDEVVLEDGVLRLRVRVGGGPLPSVGFFRTGVLVDGLPPGVHDAVLEVGIVDADYHPAVEFQLSVAEIGDPVWPLPVTVWPPDPTVLDTLWLLVEPLRSCSGISFEPLHVGPNPMVVVDEHTAACAPGELPELVALELGRLPDAEYINMIYRQDGEVVYRGPIPLEMRQRLSSRLSGSWYDPQQSGHGLNLEILRDGRVALYWYTFDALGQPAWITAVGDQQGLEAELEASITVGGRFPPDFDPELVERQPWGRMTLTFLDCTEASLEWETEHPGFVSGSMPLKRLTRGETSCDRLPPGLPRAPDWLQQADYYFHLADEAH